MGVKGIPKTIDFVIARGFLQEYKGKALWLNTQYTVFGSIQDLEESS